jgi:hypothetical protein
LPTSARNLELRVKDLKDTPPRANRGAESRWRADRNWLGGNLLFLPIKSSRI